MSEVCRDCGYDYTQYFGLKPPKGLCQKCFARFEYADALDALMHEFPDHLVDADTLWCRDVSVEIPRVHSAPGAPQDLLSAFRTLKKLVTATGKSAPVRSVSDDPPAVWNVKPIEKLIARTTFVVVATLLETSPTKQHFSREVTYEVPVGTTLQTILSKSLEFAVYPSTVSVQGLRILPLFS